MDRRNAEPPPGVPGTVPDPPAAPPRYPEIDALRGIAALAVVLFHFTMGESEAFYGFRFGIAGVDLFFIISGFVIFLTLERTRDWKDFLVGRFSRLYPAYWACVALCALTLAGSEPAGPLARRLLANLTMLQPYLGEEHLDGSYWTLTVELLFYALMLGVFSCKRLRSIEILMAAALMPEFIYASRAFTGHFPRASAFLGGWFPLINHLPLFLAGMVLYRLRVSGPSLARYALLAACLLCQSRLYGHGGTARYYVSWHEYAILLAAFSAIFLLSAQGRARFLVNPVTLFLGEISYALYLCHQHLGRTVLLKGLMERYGMGYRPAAAIAFAGALALAFLINRYVERPAMRGIRARYRLHREA